MNDQSPLLMTETVSILLVVASVFIMPLTMVSALALLRRWERAPHARNAAIKRDMDQLERRVAGLEAGSAEVARMQERLDFLEAVLEAEPSRAQLPGARKPVEKG